jgi:hypothetical protein
MQKKSLIINNKVLIPTQSVNVNSSAITAMRCRCAQSRRITNRLAHLERRNRQRMIRMSEYQRLRDSVPSIARRPVSKLTIITEAARLIDELEAAVLNKFQTQGIPKCLKGKSVFTSNFDYLSSAQNPTEFLLQTYSCFKFNLKDGTKLKANFITREWCS